MKRVTGIIILVLFVTLIFGCGAREKKPPRYQLPDSLEHHDPGTVRYITPRSLVDSLNRGVQMDLFFLQEDISDDPLYVVPIPGMIMTNLGDMYYAAETLSIERPIYLICLYGDDSKRMSEQLARYGHNCYYLDGGSYRLWEQMQRFGWKILPRPGLSTRQQP